MIKNVTAPLFFIIVMVSFAVIAIVEIDRLFHFPTPALTAVIPQPVPADVCMLTDGHPAYLSVTASTNYILHITYIDTAGNLVEMLYDKSWTSAALADPPKVAVVAGAKCIGAKQ